MPLTIYLPPDIEQDVRRAAGKGRQSVSAYMADLVRARLRGPAWPKEFVALYGRGRGTLPEIEDAPPDEPEPLGSSARADSV